MTIPAEQKVSKSTEIGFNLENKVYVWELPVRVFHWINAICILILFLTGLLIGSGYVGAFATEDPATSMAMIMVIISHYITAIIFTINLLVRLYWVAKGNDYAKSNPFTRTFWKGVWETTKFYLFLDNKKEHKLGHNELAQLSYWIFIGAGSIMMILSGYFLLTEPNRNSIIGLITGWIPQIFGLSSVTIRSMHHLLSWGIVIFTLIHIYMALRESWLNKNGTMTSIFTGFKTENHDNL